ncbi:MAG: 2-dehydropantoate 2-reductase [Chloroflexi bacterium]|nr:MAG: 2-dehydropantoate 2-reductase [Chloroflexota bacterium]
MKILVYGAGAVGGYVGARLAHSGHDVTLISRQVTADAITQHGLTVIDGEETIVTHPTAVSAIAQLYINDEPHFDLIIMAMKSYDLADAIDPLAAFCPEPAHIITLQNGIDVERPLIEQFGAERITAGSLTTPIRRDATNRLVVERQGRGLGLAPAKPGQDIRPWVTLFQQAGITTIGIDSYPAMKWSKALLNIVGNATSAILNRPPGVVYRSNAMFNLELRMLKEALAVMNRLNLKIVDLPGSPASRLATAVQRIPRLLLKPILTSIVAKGRGDKMPSFHIDLKAGKGKSEVLYHNGAIAQAGAQVGIPTPVNATLTDILWRLTKNELDWHEFDGKPRRLLEAVQKQEQALKQGK